MTDNDTQWVDFFFGAPQSVAELQTLEIRQPDFSQVWRFQYAYHEGVWARLESGELVFFRYLPMALKLLEDRGSLDFGINVTFGDLGEVLPDEIQRARAAGTLRTSPPEAIYRSYRSDGLEAPMYGAIRLRAQPITRTNEGSQFDAIAPQANVHKTGMLYRPDLFPGLRGFL